MTLLSSRHTNRIFKPMLVAVYMFFFAIQLSSRYYSIANFYVYQGAVRAGHAWRWPMQAGKVHLPAVTRESHPNRSHLSLDKRFYGKSILYTFYYYQLDPPCCTVHCPVNDRFAERPVLQDRRIHLLRGPPCSLYSI